MVLVSMVVCSSHGTIVVERRQGWFQASEMLRCVKPSIAWVAVLLMCVFVFV